MKSRSILDLAIARRLFFETPNYSYGTFELFSKKTGVSYTIKVKRKTEDDGFIKMDVSVIENGARKYLGRFFAGDIFYRGEKVVSEPAKSISETLFRLEAGDLDKLALVLEIYHYGKCVVCGRTLKTEKAVAMGIGEVCAAKQ